jgi:hypothetical protein
MNPSASLLAAALLVLPACGYDEWEEMDKENAAIQARAPRGTPFAELPGAMQALGYTCTAATVPPGEPHLNCEREQPYALVCRKRVRAILIQLHGRLAGALVNAGLFCF